MKRASLPLHARVDDDFRIDREQEGMVVGLDLVLVARVRLLVAHPVAQILDDGRALADPAQREHAVAVNG